MNIDAAYTRWADRYDSDRNLTRDLDASATAAVLGARRFAMTIEAGCGTGKNTPFLASISAAVLALDFSAGMLARAQQQVHAPHVQFQQADLLETWPCATGAAALVTCNLVLEHIEALAPIFREAARVLAPHGHFFLSELHPYRQYQGSQARFVDDDGSLIQIQAYTHHLSDFVHAAAGAGFQIERLDEWWHVEDAGQPPRLLSLLFRLENVKATAPGRAPGSETRAGSSG